MDLLGRTRTVTSAEVKRIGSPRWKGHCCATSGWTPSWLCWKSSTVPTSANPSSLLFAKNWPNVRFLFAILDKRKEWEGGYRFDILLFFISKLAFFPFQLTFSILLFSIFLLLFFPFSSMILFVFQWPFRRGTNSPVNCSAMRGMCWLSIWSPFVGILTRKCCGKCPWCWSGPCSTVGHWSGTDSRTIWGEPMRRSGKLSGEWGGWCCTDWRVLPRSGGWSGGDPTNGRLISDRIGRSWRD